MPSAQSRSLDYPDSGQLSIARWKRFRVGIKHSDKLGNRSRLAAFVCLRTLTFNITDLTSFDSPSLAISLNDEEVCEFTALVARDFIRAMPDLELKGALYD